MRKLSLLALIGILASGIVGGCQSQPEEPEVAPAPPTGATQGSSEPSGSGQPAARPSTSP